MFPPAYYRRSAALVSLGRPLDAVVALFISAILAPVEEHYLQELTKVCIFYFPFFLFYFFSFFLLYLLSSYFFFLLFFSFFFGNPDPSGGKLSAGSDQGTQGGPALICYEYIHSNKHWTKIMSKLPSIFSQQILFHS